MLRTNWVDGQKWNATVANAISAEVNNANASAAAAQATADAAVADAATRVSKTASTWRAYGTDGSGNQTTHTVASSATANTVAYRGSGGVLPVGTPVATADATTKGYVDTAAATKAKIYAGPSGDILMGPNTTNNVVWSHPEIGTYFSHIVPMVNDLSYLIQRGGSVAVTKNGSPVVVDMSAAFYPDVSTVNFNTPLVNDVFVFEVTFPSGFFTNWTTRFGIASSGTFHAKNVTIEIYDAIAASWISVATRVNDALGYAASAGMGGAGGANPVSKLRLTCTNFDVNAVAYSFRVMNIFVIKYNSALMRESFVDRLGGPIYGDITRAADPGSANALSRKAYVDAQNATRQPLDATLTALAGITTAANKLVYATGADTFATADLTTAARGLLDDADVAAMRTTLGLGTSATTATAPIRFSAPVALMGVTPTDLAYANRTLTGARMRIASAPTGSAVTAQVQVFAGTSWATIGTLSIAAGSIIESIIAFSEDQVSGDYLRINITSVGSTTPATGVVVDVLWQPDV